MCSAFRARLIATVLTLSLSACGGGGGDGGTIQVQYDLAAAEIPSSLSDISGLWFYSDGFGYTASLVVSVLGELDYSDTDGYVGIGQIQVLDPDLNGYSFQWDWTHPDPVNAGPTGGIAYLNDRAAGEHRLVFAAWWDAIPGGSDAGDDNFAAHSLHFSRNFDSVPLTDLTSA